MNILISSLHGPGSCFSLQRSVCVLCVCVCVCVLCEDNTVFTARQWRHVYVTYEVVLAAPVVRSWSPCTSQGAHTARHPPLAHWGRSTQPHTPLCRPRLCPHKWKGGPHVSLASPLIQYYPLVLPLSLSPSLSLSLSVSLPPPPPLSLSLSLSLSHPPLFLSLSLYLPPSPSLSLSLITNSSHLSSSFGLTDNFYNRRIC